MIPEQWEARKKYANEILRDVEIEKYNYEHALCPKCFNDEFEMTCMGFMHPKNNPNKHICSKCGWKGFQRDLVSTEKIKNK